MRNFTVVHASRTTHRPSRLNHLRQLAVVHLARSQLWNFAHVFHLARRAEVGQSLGLDRGADFLDLQPGFVGDGDKFLPFFFIGPAQHCNLAAKAVVWKGSGQRVLDRRQTHHLTADFGEPFHPADNSDKTLGIDVEKGKMTLPILILLRSAPPEERERYCELIVAEKATAIAALLQSESPNGALRSSLDAGEESVRDAQAELPALPPNPFTDALFQVGDALREMLDQLRA